MDVGNKASLNITGEFTVEAWVKDGGGGGLISKDKDNTPNRGYRITVGSQLEIALYGDAIGFDAFYVTSMASLQSGIFNHVCVTYDNSNTVGGIKMYINGILSGTTTSQAGSTFSGININSRPFL